jgi:uncharacterized protein (DUF1501 family)
MSYYKNSRRNFLKVAGLVGAGLSTGGTSLFNLRNLGAAAKLNTALAGNYKAMVCLYFDGGADSFNMLIPTSNDDYALYTNARSNLALNAADTLPISPINVGGVPYGLHPSLTGMQSMFNNGNLCFLNNIGTLVNPTNKQQFYDEEVPVPLGLFSHSDQTNQWQTAEARERLYKGWAGRISDLLYDTNTNNKISMNISFNGANLFQSSEKNVEYAVDSNNSAGLTGYEETYGWGIERRAAIDKMLSTSFTDPFKATYVNSFKTSLDASLEFHKAIDEVPEFATGFDNDSSLSRDFKMVAKIIAAREKLGFTRQIFFINFGGWDNHDELLNEQMYLFNKVDKALTEFNEVLKEIGMHDDVVTFSMSEFARTLSSNGNGTDHAWGGNVFAMGGPVNGNRFFGQYPSLILDGDLDVGGGVLIPTTPNDLYFAELALWFGVPKSELATVLPNLNNFYSSSSTDAPLGFLKL